MSEDKSRTLVKEFSFKIEYLIGAALFVVASLVAFFAGISFSWFFLGMSFLTLAYVEAKRQSYRHVKKEVLDQLDAALALREKKFTEQGSSISLNRVLIREIYCDIQGPRHEGAFVVVCTMETETGKELLNVYRHQTVNGKEVSAEELIAMEEEALGVFSTLLVDQGIDAGDVMDHIEYRVKDKIESRKTSRGAKSKDDDNGGTESKE